MSRKHGWLILLVISALLIAACGPEMTPTPSDQAGGGTAAATEAPPTKASKPEPTSPAKLLVDADDWHVLGSPDAPVTIVEYSEFQ